MFYYAIGVGITVSLVKYPFLTHTVYCCISALFFECLKQY